MSLKCTGNDKKKHDIGWIRGKRAYVAAITVCNKKMLPVLLKKSNKSFTFLDLTEGVFCSGVALNNYNVISTFSGGCILNGSAKLPLFVTLISYGPWLMFSGGDLVISREGNDYEKFDGLSKYGDVSITWTITEIKVNGISHPTNTLVGSTFTFTGADLNFRDEEYGLGVSNAVDWLNSIISQFPELQTTFFPAQGNNIVANFFTGDDFSIKITETGNYHVSNLYYELKTDNDLLNDSVGFGNSFLSWSNI